MAICSASGPSLASTSLIRRWFRQEVAVTVNALLVRAELAVFRTRGAALVVLIARNSCFSPYDKHIVHFREKLRRHAHRPTFRLPRN